METFKQIVIDIETMPNVEVLHLLPEPKLDARLKDPIKIAEYKESARVAQVEKMALSPLTGKIACIGIKSVDNTEVLIGEEKAILADFFRITRDAQLITYNGKAFDVPFIYKRAIILGFKPLKLEDMKLFTERYKINNHIDLMTEFCNYGEYEKLDNLARFILGETKAELDYKEIPTLLETPKGVEKLKAYCAQDCELTWKLAERFGYII